MFDDSSDGEEIPLCSAPAEPPAKRQRSSAVDAVAASWRGSRPLEETERRPSAIPKEKPKAPVPRRPVVPAAVDDGVDTLYVANLPMRATVGLLRQHCVETLGDDDAGVTDCRVVEKARRFAFVECKNAATARRLLDALDGEAWLGTRLVANVARPRNRDPAEDRREAYEKLADHVEKREKAKTDAYAKKQQSERAQWEKEHGPRVRAEQAAAKAAGHFGHGFGSDGRPRLHSGYADML